MIGAEYKIALTIALAHMKARDLTAEREIVLSNIFVGPAIMYLTAFDVIGTPNHNNGRGILDTWRLVRAPDDKTAHSIILARGIDYILIDDILRRFAETAIYKENNIATINTSGTATTFVERLDDGVLPTWLVPKELPEEFSDQSQNVSEEEFIKAINKQAD